MSLLSDYHAGDTRSRAMSLHQTSVYAGIIGGSALTGWLAYHWGWRTPFVCFAVAGVLLSVFLKGFLREPPRGGRSPGQSTVTLPAERRGNEEAPAQMPMGAFLRVWARTPTAIALAAAFFGANFVALVFLTWMPTFLNEKFHLNVAKAGLGATFFIQVASMVGAALGGVLADRWRQRFAGGRILTQAVGALFGAPFIFLCGQTRDRWTLVGAMTLFGLCKGLYDANIWASLYDVVPPARRAAAVGLMNMIAWIGGGLGAYAVGAAVTRGMTMSAAIASTGGIYVAVALLLFLTAVLLAPRDVSRRTP
jgi:predicted MFS family arabinose efflux permease